MMKNKLNKIETDINANFEPSLWNFIGQKKTISILKTVVSQYYNDKTEGRNPDLPSILLLGESGRRTIAQAIHNSFGNIEFREVLGKTLGMGENVSDYFLCGFDDITYFINACDDLSSYSQSLIFKLLNEKLLYIFDPYERKTTKASFPKRLIIFSAYDKERVIPALYNSIDVHCNLTEYSVNELFQIMKQRCSILNWKCESDKILEHIARVSNGNVDRSIRILFMVYRIMRSQDKNVMNTSHLNKALHLMALEGSVDSGKQG